MCEFDIEFSYGNPFYAKNKKWKFERAKTVAVKNLVTYLGQHLTLSNTFYDTIAPMLGGNAIESIFCVVKAGRICTVAYWIDQGYSRSFQLVKDEEDLWKDVTIDFCGPKKIMLVSDGFFNNQVSKYHVEIVKGSVIVPFSRECFDVLKLTAPEAEALANNILALEKSESLEKIEMMKMKPRDRYHEFLRIFGNEIVHFFAVKHVASYLGMQPSYLSRLRSEIKRKEK
jgi:hypothetical protein